ncbi:MAG: hypothetical protein NZO16_07145 [Deltaproteobacteria bacterium]|nr:hypothetical protein [Deltaproteobacteria bacterium]
MNSGTVSRLAFCVLSCDLLIILIWCIVELSFSSYIQKLELLTAQTRAEIHLLEQKLESEISDLQNSLDLSMLRDFALRHGFTALND